MFMAFVHNSPKSEMTQMFIIGEWVNKLWLSL